MLRRTLLAILLLSIPQRVYPQVDVTQQASAIANATRDWLAGKFSTPGASGKFREVARSTQDGRLKVTYNVIVSGAPKDQNYTLVAWPINAAKPAEQMKGLSLTADGTMVCAGKTSEQCSGEKENDPVNLTLFPVPGEVVRLALVSSDQKTKIFFGIVPDPIVASGGACGLEAIRVMPHFVLALLGAKGFEANESLSFSSTSHDQSHRDDVKANDEGNFFQAMLPAVKGKQNGRTSVSVKGKTCAASLSFDWGG